MENATKSVFVHWWKSNYFVCAWIPRIVYCHFEVQGVLELFFGEELVMFQKLSISHSHAGKDKMHMIATFKANFGFTKIGSKMHTFCVIAISFPKNKSWTPCRRTFLQKKSQMKHRKKRSPIVDLLVCIKKAWASNIHVVNWPCQS